MAKIKKANKTLKPKKVNKLATALRCFFEIPISDFLEQTKMGSRWSFKSVFPSVPLFLAQNKITDAVFSFYLSRYPAIASALDYARQLEYSLILNAGISGIIPPKTFQLIVQNLKSFKWSSKSEDDSKETKIIQSLSDFVKQINVSRQKLLPKQYAINVPLKPVVLDAEIVDKPKSKQG